MEEIIHLPHGLTIDKHSDITSLDNAMAKLSTEERHEVIKHLNPIIDQMFPTMANPKTYMELVPEKQQKEEFNLSIHGKEIEPGIVSYGGVSSSYRVRAEHRASYNEWKRFWLNLDEHTKEDVPTFHWHLKDIRRFVFIVLHPSKWEDYLVSLKIMYLRACTMPDFVEMREVSDGIDELINETRKLIGGRYA